MIAVLINIIILLAIIALFVYSKLTPHKDRLSSQYRKIFDICDKIFNPVLNFFRKIAKPLQVGSGIAVDMSQIILLMLLLLILVARL
ncbi:MAG: YggT family protein [Prevotellaceae bacterium]|nr:YggT family protein [Prevotellaceae bacterium]